jgi:hypothetical protein
MGPVVNGQSVRTAQRLCVLSDQLTQCRTHERNAGIEVEYPIELHGYEGDTSRGNVRVEDPAQEVLLFEGSSQ